MADATFLKRLSAVSVATMIVGLGALTASAQGTSDALERVNQDELASFYGRMNVVVGSGARAFGMGGAFLARADDATAASWNPAGLSYLRRTEFSLVGVHNDFSQRIPRQTTETADNPSRPITTVDQLQGSVADFVGLAFPLRIGDRGGAIQVSYQRSFSFTGRRHAEGTNPAKGFSSNGATVLPTEFTVEGTGGFDSLSLSSGFELHPNLRLGVSVNKWVRGFTQSVVRPERFITSTWDISGTNFNVGALLTPTPKLNLGAVFKTPFNADVVLSKSRTDLPPVSTSETTTTATPRALYKQGNVIIRFPRVYGVGASLRPTNTITVSADYTRTDWSRSSISGFFSLRQPLTPADPSFESYPTLPFPAVEAAAQADTSQLRVGAEWVLRFSDSGNALFPVRAGFFRDGQPGIIELRQSSDATNSLRFKPTFTGVTAGLGVTVGAVLFDVAFIRETGEIPASRGSNKVYDSVQRVQYNRVFASMIVRFGPRR